MKVDKAIDYLVWECKNVKATQKKVDAINSVIDFVNLQRQEVTYQNQLLAKLWLHIFTVKAETEQMPASLIINHLDAICAKDLYQMVLEFKNKVPFFKFNSIGYEYKPLDKTRYNDFEYVLNHLNNRNEYIIDSYQKELTEALKTTYTEKQAIAFLEKQINELINKYEKPIKNA